MLGSVVLLTQSRVGWDEALGEGVGVGVGWPQDWDLNLIT